MKKYLLLASVAGCLLAHNAMADDNITLKAKINILPSCVIYGVGDIDYGDVGVAANHYVDLSMDFDGTISTEDDATSHSATGTPGMFSLACNVPATVTYDVITRGTTATQLTDVSIQCDDSDLLSGDSIGPVSGGAHCVVASEISTVPEPGNEEFDAVQINFAY